MYDIAIIGAGINGCSVAKEFTDLGKKVIIFDINGIASGGSGAAGAFISPKFSKSGELKEIVNDAFVYSMEYYEKNFPSLLKLSLLLHIAKDRDDDEVLKVYKNKSSLELLEPSQETLNSLSNNTQEREKVCINAGVVKAEAICLAMAKSAKFVKMKVENLVYDDGMWVIEEIYSAKELVLATGAYEKVLKEPYINLRGVWGHRIDIQTTTQVKHSFHQFVSISSSSHSKIAIGATHNVHYHPQTSKEPYDNKLAREELIEKATRSLKLDNIKILKDYTGLRSGSFDYMPLVGRLVMSKETLQNKKLNFKVKKADYDEYSYYPNLYMINGSGGYGFVLAPYLAKILKNNIMNSQKISDRLSPARFFFRWAKKIIV